MANYRIRAAEQADGPFLGDMVVEAANWAPHAVTTRYDVLTGTVHSRYIAGWMRPGDAGFVAVDEQDSPIGAAWYRMFPRDTPGFGFAGPGVPELVTGVRPIWRAHGVGRALLQKLCGHAREAGFARVSLSVQRGNFAVGLYKSEGFVVTQAGHGGDVMVKRLH